MKKILVVFYVTSAVLIGAVMISVRSTLDKIPKKEKHEEPLMSIGLSPVKSSISNIPKESDFFYPRIVVPSKTIDDKEESKVMAQRIPNKPDTPRSSSSTQERIADLEDRDVSLENYTLDVGYKNTLKEALALIQRLNGRGLNAYYVKETLDGKDVYKIRVGFYENPEQAEQLALHLKENGIDSTILKLSDQTSGL